MSVTAGIQEFLTFSIGDDQYAIHVSRVTETMQMTDITRVPKARPSVRGVINLRGTVVTVIDLAIAFGYAHPGEYGSIIVAEAQLCGEEVQVGVLADTITEVIRLDVDSMGDLGELGANVRSDLVDGVATAGDRFVIVLDVDRVLGACEE
jgi:purine-binding chemotaxis protein CheW